MGGETACTFNEVSMRPFALLALLFSSLALGDPLPVSETVTCTANVCTRSAMPASAAEGISLIGVRAIHVSVCAASGQTLGGGGTIQFFLWDSFLNLPMSHTDMYWPIKVTSTSCIGAACQCQVSDAIPIPDFTFRPDSIVAAAYQVTVSGGASITVTIYPTTSR